MIAKNGRYPDGIELKPKKTGTECASCSVRQMTEEERAFYGLPNLPLKKRDKPRPVRDPVFGEDVRRERMRRKQEGMNQKDFAKMCGITVVTLNNVENARCALQLGTRKKICEALGWEEDPYDKVSRFGTGHLRRGGGLRHRMPCKTAVGAEKM